MKPHETIRRDLSNSDFVAGLPKVELHVHVEGTIEPETLFGLAESNGIRLPYTTVEGAADYQASLNRGGKENLVGFLEALDTCREVLRTPDDYHTITVEFLKRCQSEGVRYVEMMFDPQQAVRQGVDFEACVDALDQGRQDGLRDWGVRSQWIMCFQRDHPASEAPAMIEAAKQHSAEIVGVGLDNYETPGFPEMFEASFDLARSAGFRLTSHCDVNQADSFDHIRACIETLGVERIDHGLNVSESPELLELILERNISLTGCPTFYSDASACKSSRLQMIRTLADAGVSISLNTDDPAQFGSGWMSKTVLAAMMAAPFSRSEIVRFNRNAIQSAWISDEHRHELLAEVEEFCAESTH